MASTLIITSAEQLQDRTNKVMNSFNGAIGIYVSLNKTQKSIEEIFIKEKINVNKLFFIDCVAKEKTRDDVLYGSLSDLEELTYSINSFIESIKGEKFLVIDALSTLLIYNTESKVAAFVEEILKNSSPGTEIIALSPGIKGEELLKKIFNFFDKVENY